MAILKLTTSSVEFDKAAFPDFSFKVNLEVCPSEGFTSNDHGGRKLAQELNERLTRIQVDLSCVGRGAKTEVSLYGMNLLLISVHGDNVLEDLRDRFKDEIRFTVQLSPILARNCDCGPVISSEKMKINHIQKTCNARLSPLSDFLPHFIQLQDKWKLTTEIHIPESPALAGPMDVRVSKFDEPQFLQMLEDEVFCDVNISAGNGAIVKAHKMFLGAARPVLRATLEEKAKEVHTGTLNLEMTEMSEIGLRAFMLYLYSYGKDLSCPKEEIIIAYELLNAAHKYGLPKLEILMARLFDEADDEDIGGMLAFKIYTFLVQGGCKVPSTSTLKAKAIRIIKLKWDELEACQEFREFFKNGANWETGIALFRDLAKSQMDYYYDRPVTVPKNPSTPEKEPGKMNAHERLVHELLENESDCNRPTSEEIEKNADKDKAKPEPVSLRLPSEPTAGMKEIQAELESFLSQQLEVDDRPTTCCLMGILKNAELLQSCVTGELIKSRKMAYRKNSREEMESKLRKIDKKWNTRFMHNPLYPDRPYGLPEDTKEDKRKEIWELIFEHVHDLTTLIQLREVCGMFRELVGWNLCFTPLVGWKYMAARLPQVISCCLERNLLPNPIKKRSNWAKTLTSLRVLSKATKNAVDVKFNRDLLVPECDDVWFWLHFSDSHPHFCTEEWKIPTLELGSLKVEQARLRRILKTLENDATSGSVDYQYFPMKALMFTETGQEEHDGVRVDLRGLRNGFQRCVEKLGIKITSFVYSTEQSAPSTYHTLRRWLQHLPNLEELMIDFLSTHRRRPKGNSSVDVEPFPACPKLKRFAEGRLGFGYPYINEILKANPTVQELLLGEIPCTELEINNLKQVIGPLHLTNFFSTAAPTTTLSFFECESSFQWTLTLTHLFLWDKRPLLPQEEEDVPSHKLFAFLSQFKNLKDLAIMSSSIVNTGTGTGPGCYLDLPKVTQVVWRVTPNFHSLEFLKSMEHLEYLMLDLRSCPRLQTKERIMKFLAEYHVPLLFPAMQDIDVLTEGREASENIWRS